MSLKHHYTVAYASGSVISQAYFCVRTIIVTVQMTLAGSTIMLLSVPWFGALNARPSGHGQQQLVE